MVRKILRLMLNQLNFQTISEAGNGEEAKKVVRDHAPDLIICDINMTPTNGMEFLRELRSGSLGSADTPLIFLTSSTENSTIEDAISLDVNAYLAKPVSREILQQTITEVMTSLLPDDRL